MKSSIYISNKKIQVFGYNGSGKSAQIVKYAGIDLPEQAVINGIPLDAASVKAKLTELRSNNPDMFAGASLTIDSSSIFTKRVSVPVLQNWQNLDVARKELADFSDSGEELTYDYSLYTTGGERSLLACALKRSVIETYLDIFKDAGIKLDSIHVGLDLIIQYVKNDPKLSSGIIALNIVDEVSIFSLLFENGNYTFSRRTRIFAETEDEFSSRLLQNMTALVQFNKDLSTSYFVGVSPEIIAKLREIKPDYMEIDVQKLTLPIPGTLGAEATSCVFPYFGATATATNVNFLKAYKDSFKKQKTTRFKPVYIIPIVVVALALLFFGFLKIQQIGIEKENRDMEAYLSDPQNIATKELVAEKQKEIDFLRVIKSQLDEKQMNYAAAAKPSPEVLLFLASMRQGSVEFRTIDFSAAERKFIIGCTSGTQLEASSYVSRIENYKDFDRVAYVGYSDEAGKGFFFSLEIILK